jgi:hypothetical protein
MNKTKRFDGNVITTGYVGESEEKIRQSKMQDYLMSFSRELANFILQRNWQHVQWEIDLLDSILAEFQGPQFTDSQFSLIMKLLKTFLHSISLGDVTEELFIYNLRCLVDVLDFGLINPKSYLGLNISPYLYLDESDIQDLIITKFTKTLKWLVNK